MISGAKYSSVPTKELARASGSATSKYVVGSRALCKQHQHTIQMQACGGVQYAQQATSAKHTDASTWWSGVQCAQRATSADHTDARMWWGGVQCAQQATSVSHTDAAAVAVHAACLSLYLLVLHKVMRETKNPVLCICPYWQL